MPTDFRTLFSDERLCAIFPPERTNDFFEALLGDSDDGAYDIRLKFMHEHNGLFDFEFQLHQRPGRCLACNLTYGLPQVFARHPVINAKGVARDIATALGKDPERANWDIGSTREYSAALHAVPFTVTLS
ncbi:hypothetical protein GGQ74_000306 [Desulfobaculum xiamenense]|uniref:Pancreas/duodenum homeobox protein 1 n=1 Tax=Desulfobaculum xiamenense TaxID=995050 RepID=A0A846QD62_9BACT|nr:pancreas/duodenum homeobox protein 1 [Desulfobaculum xiamenense]NJB66666.1 hypothetical protein [Desulfobaculum xiamenense]